MPQIASIAAGVHHSLVLDENGHVWSFGENNWGELGFFGSACGPRQILGLPKIFRIAAGYGFSLLEAEDGNLWSFGRNSNGELGLGTWIHNHQPFQIPSFGKAQGPLRALVAGLYASFVVDSEGVLFGSGANSDQLLGEGPHICSFARMEGLPRLSTLAVALHALGLDEEGNVWGWGCSQNGKLGEPVAGSRLPGIIARDVEAVAVGQACSALIDRKGLLWVMGCNMYGQLGLGDSVDRTQLTLLDVCVFGSRNRMKSAQSH